MDGWEEVNLLAAINNERTNDKINIMNHHHSINTCPPVSLSLSWGLAG